MTTDDNPGAESVTFAVRVPVAYEPGATLTVNRPLPLPPADTVGHDALEATLQLTAAPPALLIFTASVCVGVRTWDPNEPKYSAGRDTVIVGGPATLTVAAAVVVPAAFVAVSV